MLLLQKYSEVLIDTRIPLVQVRKTSADLLTTDSSHLKTHQQAMVEINLKSRDCCHWQAFPFVCSSSYDPTSYDPAEPLHA